MIEQSTRPPPFGRGDDLSELIISYRRPLSAVEVATLSLGKTATIQRHEPG